MQTMLDLLEKQAIEKDTEVLEKFYDSVRRRAEGIDNAEGKQRIIIELYDKFFKTAFPKMVEQLGIVYTPVEVVDFIIHSVNDILKKEFGRNVDNDNDDFENADNSGSLADAPTLDLFDPQFFDFDQVGVVELRQVGDLTGADPRREGVAIAPRPEAGLVAVTVGASVGDYRSGDDIWCRRLAPEEFGQALNRDLLLPRPAGRFLFSRLIGREEGKLHLLPLGAGQRQIVVADPPWAAVATRLIRNL